MGQPILSIIIPCYNNGNLLKEMINCFKVQTSPDWEMIIVDDISTDNTPQLIKEYIKDDSRIKFYQRDREPKGSVVCRNIGFEKSTGKYIAHLDADDLVSEKFVEGRVSFMESHPDVDYASFPAKMFKDPNKLPTFSDPGKNWGTGKENEDLLKRFLSVDYPFSTWNNIYRRESIKDIQWDENVKIYTDFSFIIPCILKGLKHSFSNTHELDYFYRVANNPGNMCSNFVSQEKCDSTIYLFHKTINQLKENGLWNKYKKYFFDFHLAQLERLLLSSEPEKSITYTQSFFEEYGKKRRTLFTLNMTGCISNQTLKKNLLYNLYFILFGKTIYLKRIFISLFKKIKGSIN